MAIVPQNLLPLPSQANLRQAFVGRNLQDVPTPAAVIDIAVVERNCNQMLKACEALHLDFRPHVKTHKCAKTAEVARLQIGEATNDVRVVVSTMAEAEHLLDYLVKSREDGKKVNVLYGIPLPPSQVHRLAQFGKKLGPSSISILIDDVSQLPAANVFKETAGFPLHFFIKVDTGYHRAGLSTDTESFRRLVQAVFSIESNKPGVLAGFYSHAGHSYGGDSAISAMETLVAEIAGLEKAAAEADSLRLLASSGPQYILSVGASPTTTSIENLQGTADRPTAEKLNSIIQRVKRSYSLELHAGVYPFLDMQQLATHASPSAAADRKGTQAPISLSDIALSILVEVASVYSSREKPEALLAAGTLALGREPCKSYDGWGIVSDWGREQTSSGRSGWKVGRISQEHSVLTEDMDINREEQTVLQVGQKLRIFPNHACVASAGFSWYLIVDSNSSKERQDRIVDVWVRCRGW